MKVNGKVWVVTGAGSGLGRALALHLLDKGSQVALVDINEAGMEETKGMAGDKGSLVSIHPLNVADRDAVSKLPDAVVKFHGHVDGLINNAGIIHPFIPVKDLEYDRIERVMNINFYGALYMCKAFIPLFLERPEAHIVNVSSLGGFMPFPGQTIYGASKAAMKLMTEGLYAELKDTNVYVTVIHPGAMDTNIMSNSGLKGPTEEQKAEQGNKVLGADKAAQILVRAIEKNKFRAMVGKDARMLDIMYRIAPARAVRFIVKQMGKMRGME
ncbi:MAG: SDR family oxidoreductase [Bacteroidetes bacterium]|nr:SDR family oxidoreductase [Bacteroidota bacterium]